MRIIANYYEKVRYIILYKIDHDVTKLSAYGDYTDDGSPIMTYVVDQTEFTKLKQLVKMIDPPAFVVKMDKSKVLEEGFKKAQNWYNLLVYELFSEEDV
ncbi:uncharacterized membrane-anchored protein YitT (DUF2179 family) [Oikeobacillus pervagus]|uniref:Uncharacterized membrane-anchored protein YitT (DUF2179 family) n=1 Tax=Oikeobacillus pervagus TaxID=1325931 RepID=A0AAJ1T157_9BACI|nr:YitT family protein [Oikeobacillus pervagus]MDQ0214897.1 uncharacterized membrane-anchored protein YitT (DUF2179 family) [Oikeobacillus pervagus]